jgi:hypothetical protein
MFVRRFVNNPIVTADMLVGTKGFNINGPSLIFTPEWLPQRLGCFYLYFAHHHGRHIRLAYANHLEGPWTVYHPGTLQLADAVGCQDHIASPDVHVDNVHREIRMYFHGIAAGSNKQLSFFARSNDGIHFNANSKPIANFYLRAIPWRNEWIGMTKGGIMYRSESGIADFRQLPQSAFPMKHPMANASGDVRHVALQVIDDDLQVYFTRIGDKPERILRAHINLRQNPENWRAENAELVLSPEMEWEGTDVAPGCSKAGPSVVRENAVRDPAIFVYNDCTYLLYTVAGEAGIAIAEIISAGETPIYS